MIKSKNDLIYADECYRIMGLIFEAFNEFGFGHKEEFYQKVLKEIFKKNKIIFKEQLMVNLKYRGKVVGKYFLDFLLLDKIVLELKVRNYFSKKDIEQLYKYLKVTNLKLGLIVHFTKEGVRYKRIINVI